MGVDVVGAVNEEVVDAPIPSSAVGDGGLFLFLPCFGANIVLILSINSSSAVGLGAAPFHVTGMPGGLNIGELLTGGSPVMVVVIVVGDDIVNCSGYDVTTSLFANL